MNNYEKILDIANKNNGYISVHEVWKNGIDHKFLYDLVKRGELKKAARGLYLIKSEFYDEYYEIQSTSLRAVFSHATALYLHGLSDRVPVVLDVTVPHFYSGSLQTNEKIKLHYVKDDKKSRIWPVGLQMMKSPLNNDIRVYSVERTICDIVKNKNKVDPEVFVKALQRYANRKNKDTVGLIKIAKLLKIEDKIREYMEILS